jgi:hypothetical protein
MGVWRVLRHASWSSSQFIGLAIFSHWILDCVVHVPDLPLYDNTMKVGLGLWNRPPRRPWLRTPSSPSSSGFSQIAASIGKLPNTVYRRADGCDHEPSQLKPEPSAD